MKRRWFLTLLGLAISVLAAAWVIRRTDLHAVWIEITGMGLPALTGILAIYALGFVPRAWRSVIMARGFMRFPAGIAAEAVILGYAANNVLPLRLGEIVRVLFTAARTHTSKTSCLALVAAERLIDAACLAAVLLGALVALRYRTEPVPAILESLAGPAIGLIAAALLGLVAVFVAYPFLVTTVERIGNARVQAFARRLLESVAYLRAPGTLFGVIALTLLVWLCEGGLFVGTCWALSIPDPLLAGYLTLAVANLSVLIPSSPGYVGIFHAAAVFALEPLGVPTERALAVGLLCHAIPYIAVTLTGLGIFIRHQSLLFGMARTPRSGLNEPAGPRHPGQ